jgi:hypothetical protein
MSNLSPAVSIPSASATHGSAAIVELVICGARSPPRPRWPDAHGSGMRTYEDSVIRVVKKRPDRGDFAIIWLLARPRRIEAENYQRIDAPEKFSVKQAQIGIRPPLRTRLPVHEAAESAKSSKFASCILSRKPPIP